MNKEDILEKSRKENKGKHDERELAALARAGQIAAAVGGMLCAIIILLESIFSDSVSTAPWAIYLGMTGTTLLVKYVKLRKPHELLFALLELALAIIFIVMFIIQLLGGK